jgi:transaldolase
MPKGRKERSGMQQAADWMLELIERDLARRAEGPRPPAPSSPVWAQVRATGTRLWLDTGDIAAANALWTAEFEALTTNNTLLNAEVQKGQYDDLIREAAHALVGAQRSADPSELRLEIALLLNAVHGRRLAVRFGAKVSVELHTDLAHDVERSVQFARRLFAVDPEHFIIKIPMTAAGLVATRRLVEEGIPVNFTLGFSARQNVLATMVARPNFVNVFMGRLNAYVADQGLGDGQNVGEKATLSTQRWVRWCRRTIGVSTRLIGASMRDASQVAKLAGVDVFTMPPKVAAAYAQTPAEAVVDRTNEDPPVVWAAGITERHLAADTLWDVPDEFVRTVRPLAQRRTDELTPDLIVHTLRSAGFADLFPEWTPEECRELADGGKIPRHENWRAALETRKVGLDALMNGAGLYSFMADQRALDERILRLIAAGAS